MTKSAIIHARIEPEVKAKAEKIFKKLGISMAEAINLFLSQVNLQKGLPFEARIPNRTTRKSLENIAKSKNLIEFATVEEARKYFGI